MDGIEVTEPRGAVPDWANEKQVIATQAQLNYLRDLSTLKDLSSLSPEQRASLQQPEEFWIHDTTRLSKSKAHRAIDLLVHLPSRPREGYESTDWMRERIAVGVPAGRYAIENADGELRFYNNWASRDGKRMKLYILHGPDQTGLTHHHMLQILNKIKDVGVRSCAIRYGFEIGSCSNCGRRLTNRISRELGIGPVCGGRMFGDDFKTDVKIKRAEILARGEDPNEEFE